MLAALAPATFASDRELEDARESLAYWETRARTLPLHAVRRRREARIRERGAKRWVLLRLRFGELSQRLGRLWLLFLPAFAPAKGGVRPSTG